MVQVNRVYNTVTFLSGGKANCGGNVQQHNKKLRGDTMQNRDVAEMLDRAARILAMRGENRYRIRAYKRAARAVASSEAAVEMLVRENKLQVLSGVGPGIADKINEIVRTGSLSLLERLETGRLPLVDEGKPILLGSALTIATELIPAILALDEIAAVQLAGEARRCTETMTELVLVVSATDLAKAKSRLSDFGQLHHLRWDGNHCSAMHSVGLPVTLFLVDGEAFALTLWLATGSAAHVEQVAKKINEKHGQDILHQDDKGALPLFADEAEVYQRAGLPFIHPELREGLGEVDAPDALPALIRAADYQGDLHVHTDWSDGTAAVEKMVQTAMELGYAYLAVTDHSRSLKIAQGLSLERLAEQRAYIRRLQDSYPGIRIFSGIEADILDDGSVDAPDEVLSELDVVIASVHSGFRQSREKLTARICRAMQNPHVQIIGHATGRLLGKRDPYAVDMDEVIRTAAATGTALEINASPDRLDINGILARRAREAGVQVAINTDAHSQLELANVQLGILTARRGWLEAKDVLNTLGASEVLTQLRTKKKSRR
jgi:DNA polymerase (family X)